MSNAGAVRDTPGEARPRRTPGSFGIWLGRHFQALLFTIGEMWRARLATLLTVSVIGIALALPSGLYIAVDNIARIGGMPADAVELSLFLRDGVDEQAAESIAGEIRNRPGIAAVTLIPPAQALDEYARQTGLGDVTGLFGGENPLPSVLVVTPARTLRSPQQIAELAEALGTLNEVESVQSDMQWMQRLAAWMALVRRLLLVIALLLGGGVLLVIGNTVRVAAQGRREEIAVARLCGATDSFIRRPFLYAGLLYGLLGAATAGLIVSAALAWLEGPVRELSSLYVGDFALRAPGGEEALLLLLLGATLGLLGAWVAVARMLATLDA